LVTGDIIQISLGDKIPADVRFIDTSSDLKLDRAVLTGESEPVAGVINSTDVNFLETKNVGLQGTLCVSGSGQGGLSRSLWPCGLRR
jgi:sodium/potassium-transporting ATPase subunit alpha